MDLIDRDVACQKMTALYEEDCKSYGVSIPECFDSERAIKALKELPSVEPKIIRCKDCKWWWQREVKINLCPGGGLLTDGEWFCSNAERINDE